MSYQVIDPRTASEKLKNGCRLIDVRTPIEYAEVHAVGAENLPLDVVTAAKLPSGEGPVVILCKSGSRARKAAEKLLAEGVGGIFVVEGGTDAWVASQLPVLRSETVMSLERQVRLVVGIIVLGSLSLGVFVNLWFLAIAAFVSCGLIFSAVTNTCGMALVLAKMPWNVNVTCDVKQKRA